MDKAHSEQFVLLVADKGNPDIAACRNFLQFCCPNLLDTEQPLEIGKLISAHRIDLILMDIALADCRGISQVATAIGTIPIIAITSETDPIQNRNLILAGFDDCLAKPVDFNQLGELLRIWGIACKDSAAMVFILRLLAKTHGDHQLALGIFQRLFAELPTQLTDIKTALGNQHYAVAEEINHKLIGSVSLCGFVDIQLAAQTFSNKLAAFDYTHINLAFNLLEEQIINFLEQSKPILAYFGQ